MAATGKVRARLALAIESVLGRACPPGRHGWGRWTGGSDVEPLEQRIYFSRPVTPMIYGVETVAGNPSTPSYTLYLNASGVEVSQITSVNVNWGDYVTDSSGTHADIQECDLHAPTYPFVIATHAYASNPANYTITAQAYVNGSPSLPIVGMSLDPSFGATSNGVKLGTSTSGSNDAGYGVAIDTSGSAASNYNYGKIYVADTSGGQIAVIRYNADGTLDTSFGTNGIASAITGTASAVAVDSQGNVVVAGTSNDQFAVARFLPSGAPDPNFNNGNGPVLTALTGQAQANAVAVQPDGRIVVAGTSNLNAADTMAAVRYNSDGQIDTTFGPDGNGTVETGVDGASDCNALLLQTVAGNTDYILGGTSYPAGCGAYDPGNFTNLTIARLTSNGTLDTSFGSYGGAWDNVGASAACWPINGCCGAVNPSTDAGYSLAEQPDGSIILGGTSNFMGIGSQWMVLARFTASGGLDVDYGSEGLAGTGDATAAYGAAMQPDGKVVLAGSDGSGDFVLARYNTSGVLDPTFGFGGTLATGFNNSSTAGAQAVAIQPDGRIVAAGFSGSSAAVARYQPINQIGVTDVQPPLITSSAPNVNLGAGATAFSYTIAATDPNNPAAGLTYSLLQPSSLPSWLQWDPASGTLSIPDGASAPVGSTPTLVPVTLEVTNAEGLDARQGLTLIVHPQAGPTIAPIPGQAIYAGSFGTAAPSYTVQASGVGTLQYAVQQADPNDPGQYGWLSMTGDQLNFSESAATSENAARAQPYRVKVLVTDGNGVQSQQTFLVRIYTAHTPLVTLTAPNTSITTGGTLTFHVSAFDPSATSQTLASVVLQESTDGGTTWTSLPNPPAALTPDSSANASWDIPWTAPPTVPAQDPFFRALVTDTTGGTTMGTGETDMPAALLPSSEPGNPMVQRGLDIHVYTGSTTTPETPELHVPDEQTIAIDNIPVPITRAYDSTLAGTVGDFGYGWSLDLGGALHTSTGNGTLYQSGQHVEVIAPNGRPEGFSFRPRFIGRDASVDEDAYVPDFVPDPGVTDTLSAVSASEQTIYKPDGVQNSYYLSDQFSRYRPDSYALSTPSGITYQFNTAGSGNSAFLVSATDGAGDSVTFSNTVIQGYNSQGQNDSNITFARDAQNRISNITVTRGTTTITVFSYGYDPSTGDLDSVTDVPRSVTTNYAYTSHLLTGITQGTTTTLSVTYNSGSPVAATDGNGTPVPVIYDASIGTEIHSRAFTLADGTLLVNLFTCVNGLPLRETDGVGSVVDRTFDGNGSVLTQTAPYKSGDALRITRYTYDRDENLTTATDPQGNRSWSAWSFNDKLEVSVAPMGNETTNVLGQTPDISGDLDILYSIDAQGNASKYNYQTSGLFGVDYQLSTISTPAGTDSIIYGDPGSAGSTVYFNAPTGASTADNYDTNGNLATESQSQGDTSSTSSNAGTLQSSTTNGLTTNFMPDPNGAPVPSSSPDGSSIFIYESARGILETAKVPSSYLSSADSISDYDFAGRVIDTIDPLGNKTTLVLDWDGRTVSTIMPGTARVHADTAYDNGGRVSSSTDVHGVTTHYLYDAGDRLIQTTYADGSVQQTVYDALGRPVATSDRHLPTNPATGSLMSYDSAGNLVQTQFVNNIVITIVDDGNGIYHSVLTSAGTATATQETVYDGAGRPSVTTDRHAPGAAAFGTGYTYDTYGNASETDRLSNLIIPITTLGNASDSWLSPTGTIGVVSSVYDTYDGSGHLTLATGADGQTTRYEYNSSGLQSDVIDPFDYDAHTGYDTTTGRVNLIQGPLYDPTSNLHQYETQISYDQSTGIQTTTHHHKVAKDDVPFTTSTTSDGAGHTISSTDALGRTTSSQYNDPSGQLTQVTQPQVTDPSTGNPTNPTYRYQYDPFGDSSDQIDALGRDTHFATVYNNDGSRTETRTLPDGTSTETTLFDTFGRISQHTDFKGQVTKYTYDPLTGRLSETDFYTSANAPTPSETIRYQYDTVTGNLTVITDTDNGVVTVTTNTYDPNTQNLLSVTTTQASASSVIHYAYNTAGQHTATWTGAGSTDANSTTDTFYAYDELGRLRTVTVTRLNGATLATPQVTTSLYDPDGNLARTLLPNGTRTVYQYDDLDHLVATSNIGPGLYGTDALLSGYAYAVDNSGRRNAATEQRLESDGTYSTSLYTWTYDNLDRLLKEQLSQFDGQYSEQNLGFQPQDYTANYVLDLVGNRLSKTTTQPGQPTEVINYAYDNNDGVHSDDHLMTETATLGGNAEYSTSYGYDFNGSTTSKTRTGTNPESDTYTYDLQNRLQTSTINSTQTTYGYDGPSDRISETTGSTATYYLIDNNNPTGYSQTLQESASLGGTPTTTYMLGTRVLAQANGSGAILFLMPDGRGGTRLITNASATMQARYDFDAFGNAIGVDQGSALTKYLFDGQQYDSGAAQYFLRTRQYAPSVGRFSEADAHLAAPGDLLNANPYLYTDDNPINIVDPNGYDGLVSTVVTAGINSGLLSVGIGAPIRAYQTVRELRSGVSVQQALLNLAERELFDFGVGFATGAAFKGLQLAQLANKLIGQGIESVFSKISFASPVLREGTQIPTYFQLETEAGPVFIKEAATKHFPQIVEGVVKRAVGSGANDAAGLTRSASALMIESLESAITKALSNPRIVPVGKLIVVDNWDLVFGTDIVNPVLRTVYHAVPRSGIVLT